MWTVVFIAHNKAEAEELQRKLSAEGLLVKIKPIGCGDSCSYEILVPASEVEEAMEVINSF